jgi:hypothetical protein
MTPKELWHWMMDGNYPDTYPDGIEHRTATAVLTRELAVKRWCGHNQPSAQEVWPAGKRVKVVMASRFGDVGITDDLSAEHGYHYRTQCVEGVGPGNAAIHPDDLLSEITPIHNGGK